jgi:hypothetical protein
MRVTQILALLKLAPSIVAYARSLPPGTPKRRLTERRLRELTGLSPKEQVLAARASVPGFASFLCRNHQDVA